MRGIRFVELVANVKANIVAFFSIAMFVALGVGLLLGIQWGNDALLNAMGEEVEAGAMHDIEVQFPYGVTADNLDELKGVEGVSQLEYGYTSYASMIDGNEGYTLKFQSITPTIDRHTRVMGSMPVEKNEIALLRSWAEGKGVNVGDELTLKHDVPKGDASDADGMRYLTTDTFTITGLVDNPAYVSTSEGSLGVTNIGSGTVDCVGFVTEQAFDMSALADGYTNVYIRSDAVRGMQTTSNEYRETLAPIVQRVEELGKRLGSAQYNKVHGQAQSKLSDAERQLADGERQLTEGQQRIADGERELAEGREKLESGQQELVESVGSAANEQSSAQSKLESAYRQLADAQARFDAGIDQYNTASELYNQINSKFESVHSTYDTFITLYTRLREMQAALLTSISSYDRTVSAWESGGAAWTEVEDAYTKVKGVGDSIHADFSLLGTVAETVGSVLGLPLSVGEVPTVGELVVNNADRAVASVLALRLAEVLDRIAGASITVNGTTVSLTDIPGGLARIYEQLSATKATLDAARVQLQDGWAEYNRNKALYDEGVAEGQEKLSTSEKELADGKALLEQKSAELESGKAQLEEKSAELEKGKTKLEDARAEFAKLVEYEWVVMPRNDSGGIQKLNLISGMMGSVKWAMASLFVLVGLFVCYSAVSRLVHEQMTQIGTKKALGFRKSEIAQGYLAFSGLAVALGILLSLLIAVFLVQLIMNPIVIKQFAMMPYGPYVSVLDLLVVGCIELVLILASTWFAISGMLKLEATELLRGETTANVREHFYERTLLWKHMSLFSQTVVNNCVNDKRRVAGTLVGVVGCTALIVTAMTLATDVALSLDLHYEEVYSFDSIAYMDEEGDGAVKQAAMALYDHGVMSSPAFMRSVQMTQSDGTRNVTTLVVPTNEESFKKFYNVVSTTGEQVNVENGGLWVSAAYCEHTGAKVGDSIELKEFTGKTHSFRIAGFFDYYLLRAECVLSPYTYREAFGELPESNVLLIDTDGSDKSALRDSLLGVEGFNTLVDDYQRASYNYDELTRILRTVVLVYLLLSGLMAVVVLLNLDIMFVSEKKRELIVLMINGYSVKDAKAYIYRDSIVLTVIGIGLGIVVGSVVGSYTVFSLEPETGYFVKGFSLISAVVGAVGAGVFSMVVLMFALRLIARFELTDINRF